jgi:hypothetical protein
VFLPALLLLTGCFKPYGDLAELDFSDLPFDNEVVQADDARVAAVDTALTCPDGEPARVFAVYRESWDGPRPTAVVLHSGAFDYVDAPTAADPFDGPGYHADDRLARPWSVAKAWETLGINSRAVDVEEDNTGALAAALVDAEVAVVVPANCWGDLWHNIEGEVENDVESEFLTRDGLGLASATVRSLVDAGLVQETGIQIPVQVDPDQLFLVGLGEGGRGVAELLNRADTPAIAAALVDSSPDALSVWAADPGTYGDEVTGLERIFGVDNLGTVDDASLATAVSAGLAPDRTAVIWSSLDPGLPGAMTAGAAEAVAALPGGWVVDTAAATHVQLGADEALAADAVTWMLGGTPGSESDE